MAKKIFIFLFLFFLLFTFKSYSLSIHDDGYAWNDAASEEKIELSKEISRKYGSNYIFWYYKLNEYYEAEEASEREKKLKARIYIVVYKVLRIEKEQKIQKRKKELHP